MGTDWKEEIPPVTTEREKTPRGYATVCSYRKRNCKKSTEMIDSAKAVTNGLLSSNKNFLTRTIIRVRIKIDGVCHEHTPQSHSFMERK